MHRQDCLAPAERCAPDGHGLSRCRPDPCRGETLLGRCDGATAIWCEANEVRREACAPGVDLCLLDSTGAHRCLPDPCQGETLRGRCDGDDVIWCADAHVRVRRCADCGQRCDFSVPHAAFYCIDP